MTTLRVGDAFPDFELPDHRTVPRRLSRFTRPSAMDERLGFTDGYPVIVPSRRRLALPVHPAPRLIPPKP